MILIYFVFIVTSIYSQNDIYFKKSPQRYFPKNFIYELTDCTKPVIDFQVYFKKENNQYLLSFGCINKICNNYICFNTDTIFYFDLENKKKPMFILKENNDTIKIQKFGSLIMHRILYEKKFYFSEIKDTVFCYKLWYENHSNLTSSEEDNYYYFKNIGISKKYGFVWIRYVYHNNEIEVRYY